MRGRKVNWWWTDTQSNAVTIPSQRSKNRTTKQNQTKNTQAKQTKTTNQTEQGKSGRQTSYVTSVMKKRDILVSSLVLVWQVKAKAEPKTQTPQKTPYPGVSKATQHYAETRAPPSQEPRDHIEQAGHDHSRGNT